MRYSPQEIEVWYVLPEVRRQLAIALKKHGLSQREIAEKLDVTPASVSHYLNSKRAGTFSLGRNILSYVDASAKRIASSSSRTMIMTETQNICSQIRKSFLLCKVHRSVDDVPCRCSFCAGRKQK